MSQHSQNDGVAQQAAPEANFVSALADEQARAAQAKSVFGEPVRQGSVTVVPVARVHWGLGGGTGKGGDGGGGGGRVRISPLGYIEIKDDHTEYKPIRDLAAYVPLIAAGGIAGVLLLRGLRKLLGK